MHNWLCIALQKNVAMRAVKVALVVGTLLVIINHFDALLAGNIDSVRIAKMLLTYLVPYSVATYSAVEAIRAHAVKE